jgi:hypothetical protein
MTTKGMTTEGMTTEGQPPSHQGSRRGKGYFLPGFIALVALLALGLFAGGALDLQHPAITSLNGPNLASQIALGMQLQQNAKQAPSVTCPAKEPVRQGLVFTCTVAGPTVVADHGRPVYVTEIDGRGQIRWSLGAPPTTSP